MDEQASHQYFETEVLTATPQRLQLMLVDGAILAARRAQQARANGDHDAACEHLIRAQEIVGQMLTGLNHDSQTKVVRDLAAVYVFAIRKLVEANMERDDAKLAEAVGVLEIERETWRQVCALYGSKATSTASAFQPSRTDTLEPVGARSFSPEADAPVGGFSIEA